MKRLASIMLIVIIMAGLCTTTVTAESASEGIKSWVLSDGVNNINVEIIQYPQITLARMSSTTVSQLKLQEVILEMDLDLAQKYFEYFKIGKYIPQLVLTGLSIHDLPVFKITMENCLINGYTVKEFSSGRLTAPIKTDIRFTAAKITAAKANQSGPPMQITYGGKLVMAKVFIDDIEYGGKVSISGIDAYMGNNGSMQFNGVEMLVDYDEIGILPDWLASFDSKTDTILKSDPNHKLRYELSSFASTKDKLSFEADLTAIRQELSVINGINRMYAKYTFDVLSFGFLVPGAGTETPPVTPAKAIIKAPLPLKTLEFTWAGNWVTTFGKMSLKQNGTDVTGEYGNPVETLEGTVSGNKLTGIWHDSVGSGKFEFTMSTDGKSFDGTMYNEAVGDSGTFDWNGERE